MENKEKYKQLGVGEGKAKHALHRKIMWDFIVKAGMHICYKCGRPMKLENYSVEHKTPWMFSDDPKKMFYDLDNIAYSHRKCNRPSRGFKKASGVTKYKGVHKNTSRGRKKIWQAVIWCKGSRYYIGSYLTDKEAAEAYDREAEKILGADFITNKKLRLLP